mgnify:CR=1 FL=1
MDKKVTIYSTPTCHFCQLAKEFFGEKGVEYTEHDVSTDLEKRKESPLRRQKIPAPTASLQHQKRLG